MLHATEGYRVVKKMLAEKGFTPFQFQEEAWQHIIGNKSGLVNAPTGCGKTFSVFLGALIDFINRHPEDYKTKKNSGLQLLWIAPLRALAKDIGRAMEEVIESLGMSWRVGIRNGDTRVAERQQQRRRMPEILITTPETLHLLLAQKGYPEIFRTMRILSVDEWHELIGSKRRVQVELAISRIASINPISIRGISATFCNLEEAKEVLMASLGVEGEIVRANMDKKIDVEAIFPDEIEKYPWAGHLGIKLAHKVLPIIEQSKTTLIFINTRGMSETWYQKLLDIHPDLAGSIALLHGSIDMELRLWV